jgi:3-dehydroquinate synthase II
MKKVWVQVKPWDKEKAIAAIESGADAVLVAKGDSPKVKELSAIQTVAEDGDIVLDKDVKVIDVTSKSDEKKAAEVPVNTTLLLRMKDWTIIPVENLIAERGNLITEINTAEEAESMIGALEKGVDGVLVNSSDEEEIRKIVQLVHNISAEVSLEEASVTRIETGGMGDRVCIDTCSLMTIGEGMLIGNTSSAFFLVHSESIQNPYVAPRPFRVNASAVHAYIYGPEGKTSYLSDLHVGSQILVVNAQGNTRSAYIGRCKIEKRPMLVVFAEIHGKEISLVLQNAETINLVTPEGKPVSVSKLKPSDKILVHLEEGARHFGMKIDETIDEH